MRTPKRRPSTAATEIPLEVRLDADASSGRRVKVVSGVGLLGGCVVAVVASAALLVAVTNASGISLLDTRPAPRPSAAGIPFSYPTAAAAAVANAGWEAPAVTVLDQTVAAGPVALVGKGATARTVSATVSGTPFARACGAAPSEVTPVLARTLPARVGNRGVMVTLWAHPAGLGGATVDTLARHLRNCGAPAVYSPAGVGAESFAASSANSGDGLAWVVWNSGDVVGQVTVAAVHGRPDVGLARAVATRTDAVLRTKLAGACTSLDSYASAASRNPYVPGYTGNTTPVTVTAPQLPDLADAAPTAGAPDRTSPRASFTLPDAQPRPDLAAPYQPDGWVPGDPDVSVADAPKGPAPVLRNPDAFVEPSPAVRSEPVEPTRPTPGPQSTTVNVAAADPAGPGCGWAFTAMTAPVSDPAALAAAKTRIVADAFTAMTDRASTYQAASLAYAGAHQQWQDKHANWVVYREYANALEQARADLAAAQSRYQDAVSALDPAPVEPTPPTPTAGVPTPTATPTLPAPGSTPTGSATTPTPSSTPTATPTGTPTGGPTTIPPVQENP